MDYFFSSDLAAVLPFCLLAFWFYNAVCLGVFHRLDGADMHFEDRLWRLLFAFVRGGAQLLVVWAVILLAAAYPLFVS